MKASERTKHNKQLEKIRLDKKIEWVYIRKGGYYYMSGFCGYTEYIHKAGVYTKEEAICHCSGIIELQIVPIDIRLHNSIIVKQISDLTSRFIL
jgi:hypothetical protein